MRVTLASPIYERAEPAFVTCLIATLDELHARGHEADWRYANAIVHQARNYLMDDMMRHKPDVLVQLDADHQFDAADVTDAIEAVGEGLADIIGFAYPRRVNGPHDGMPWTSPILRSPARPGFIRADKQYAEVDGVGGGILVCSYVCIERMSVDVPRQVLGGAPMLFDFRPDVGEDAFFCDRWRAMGGKVYCDVTSLVGHIGSHVAVKNPALL